MRSLLCLCGLVEWALLQPSLEWRLAQQLMPNELDRLHKLFKKYSSEPDPIRSAIRVRWVCCHSLLPLGIRRQCWYRLFRVSLLSLCCFVLLPLHIVRLCPLHAMSASVAVVALLSLSFPCYRISRFTPRVAWAQPPIPAAHLRCTQLKLHVVGADRARSGGVMTIDGFVKMVPHVPQPDPRSRFRCCLRAMRRFERCSPRSHRSHRRSYRKLLGTSEPQSCSPPRSPPNSNASLKVPKPSRKLRCPQVISEGHSGSKSRKLTDLAGK